MCQTCEGRHLNLFLISRFCTLFVIAFPLGPLFALLNNIFELRLDARKFLIYYKRSVPKRVSDIGIWLNVMAVLAKISVITTAFISAYILLKMFVTFLNSNYIFFVVAFSSNFIPRLVHKYSHDLQNIDYLEYTLAYFDTKDFEGDSKPNSTIFGYHEVCVTLKMLNRNLIKIFLSKRFAVIQNFETPRIPTIHIRGHITIGKF